MRLLTRADFDGLGCAVLLKQINMISEIKFVHPKDVQDGKIEVNSDDILANLPYVKGCGYWFDNHSSEEERNAYGFFKGTSDPKAFSVSRVIYHYFGGQKTYSDSHFVDLIDAVDKIGHAELNTEEIFKPKGWVLLAFIIDPRTGLERYKGYKINFQQFMIDIIDYCRTKSIDEILEMDDVKERVERYLIQSEKFKEMIIKNTKIYDKLIVTDLRNQKEIYIGNRFIIYHLHPEQNISIQIMWGLNRQNIVITCGHSVLNKTSQVNVGSLMLKYGGGGHKRVGTCQVAVEEADKVLKELIYTIINTF
ncbi:MAG: exopolyphosphatase [Desulfobacterales bacterium]|nr:exopolyphosphatase [Desulfobacterales bacterium]